MNSEFNIAVHSLVFLAYLPTHMASSDLLASNVCTNPVRIRRVMNLLKKNGLIQVQKGTGGGYILNCDPKEVTLGQIYRITSSGSLVSDWRSGDPNMECRIASQIGDVMSQIYEGAEISYVNYLSQFTIQDILDKLTADKKQV
ncbi:RrF2 family transcriptional regulator [Thermoflavimicrobium dichotomicum]|uniref:Rrf2 family protein n=1 Tax=Thermoflavimicrobium dichotomicum TaxID=46223 RepID=A0A1I3LW73_9BACL|nr:Rrf2 family transcriptional regulator [Thermoflavimicrobium dichotomicum]SFI89018.1 Rrf2 family protein [Thermoflavimicrobium dichotomicum]